MWQIEKYQSYTVGISLLKIYESIYKLYIKNIHVIYSLNEFTSFKL